MAYLMLKRQYADDQTELRSLYKIVGDTEALAELDNQIIHGSQTVVTDR